jgi:hypothetical protein
LCRRVRHCECQKHEHHIKTRNFFMLYLQLVTARYV